jgi:outer membrane protein assembly factor BamB
MTINAFNKKTGSRLWSWNEWLSPSASITNWYEYGVHKDHLLLYEVRELHKVDANTGQTKWSDFQLETSTGRKSVSVINDYFYCIHNNYRTTSSIVRCSVNDFMGWDTVCSMPVTPDGYSPSFYAPSMGISPNGDTLLVFQNRSGNWNGLYKGRIEMLCYNLNADSLLWKTTLPDDNSNVALPLVDGSRVYFQATTMVYCFDLNSGGILWQQNFGGGYGFMTGNMLVLNDRLYIGANNPTLFCVNKYSGQQIWRSTNTGGSRNDMVHYKGRIYYTGGSTAKLHCIDAQTGVQLFVEGTPTKNTGGQASFYGAEISIDPETGYLYIQDRFFAFCFKLPD